MPNLQDVRRAHIKARILTGTYLLQSTKSKFNNQQEDPKCPLCRLENEDLPHFLLRCQTLCSVREVQLKTLRELVIAKVGPALWSEKFRSRDTVLSLIVDCQMLVENGLLPTGEKTLSKIETCTRTLCYKLQIQRLKLHKHLSLYGEGLHCSGLWFLKVHLVFVQNSKTRNFNSLTGHPDVPYKGRNYTEKKKYPYTWLGKFMSLVSG